MDWAKHRRRKAAAMMHLQLNLQTFLPAFAIIEEASHHDDTRELSLCAGLQAGKMTVFDKAYVYFANLFNLSVREIFWVKRARTIIVFLTNNFEWTASSVSDLYRCRREIESYFKQIKETFKVCDLIGHSKHAIR